MIKTAIFDLDGTLLDSNTIWTSLAERYLISLGKTPEKALSERLRELPLKSAVRLVKSDYDIAFSEEEISARVMELCEDFYKSEALPKNGARELLECLAERNIEMKILTSSYAELAKAALDRLGLSGFFCDIVGGADKSSPDTFLSTSKNPCQTLVFEDALYAVNTAKGAGFVTCAVYDAWEKKTAELKAAADFFRQDAGEYARDIDEILKAAERTDSGLTGK